MQLFRFGLVCVAALSLRALGCGSDSDSGTSTSSGGSACAFTDPTCTAVKSDCISLADNANKDTFGLRMSQLKLSKPTGLQLAQSVIDVGVMMNLNQCRLGSAMSDNGLFSWLLQFDKTAGTLTTGGANFAKDPTQGYCFIKGTINGTAIAPIVLKAPLTDGKFSVTEGVDVTVPIFVVDQPPILLPLSKARITNGQLSSDQNCIGKYNLDQATPEHNCIPDNGPFTLGGSIDGFITLENADTVQIPQLSNTSLCALLTGQGTGTPPKCPRDASNVITAKGDWCSTTNMAAAGTCADAYALGAEFAASGVKITGQCPPASP